MTTSLRLTLLVRFSFGLFFLTVAGSLPARAGDVPSPAGKASAAQEEFFEAKIRPVLADNCFHCHGEDKHKGGLRLDVRAAMLKGGETGPAVVPGKPDESPLIEAIRYDGAVQMPPKKKLKADEIAALSDWVKAGAVWPEPRPVIGSRSAAKGPSAAKSAPVETLSAAARSFWSFQPVSDQRPPAVKNSQWPRSPIDRFVLARLEENGLVPAPRADKPTLIRRAYFDLIGLPPTPAEIDAFCADERPDAFDRVVDGLLASPHYGERWGRYWLDVARYGEDQAHSFQPRLYPHGYRYRDWVIKSLNRDLPYDRFILEQIAGDLLDGPDRLDRLAALGFFACGPVYYGDAKKHDQHADRIDTLTRGFLGLTVACARCHDHKYDPIPTTDYYALAGIFASSEYTEMPAAPADQVAAYDKAQAAIAAKEKEITAYVKSEVTRLKIKVAGNGGLKQAERMLPPESKARIKDLRAEVDRLKKASPAKYAVIHTLSDASKPIDMAVLIRGNADTPGDKVARRFLTVLDTSGSSFQKGSGRLELAERIASPENPLTSRVMVNRIWQHHFGRGLVGSASNFGTLGERPSHPELLDWLARRFVQCGWSQKALHREIMLSATYRQASQFDAHGFAKDPGNLLLWRMNRRRLDVEAWRDATLAVAARLDATLGGPSINLESPSNQRRTIYAAISRHDLSSMLRLFDFPDPNITSGGRVETTVPLQQLFVLNSEFMTASAAAVSQRVGPPAQSSNAYTDQAERIREAYRLLFGRVPSQRELDLGLAYLESAKPAASSSVTKPERLSRWQRYTQALLASNEFCFVD